MGKLNLLIIGSGGREHALGWKLSQSPAVKKLYFAPGNGGTNDLGENIDIGVTEIRKLVNFAKKNQIGLTIVGPEVPLSLGIVDDFLKAGLKIFGPSKKAARLESSKAWAGAFLQKYRIPHPLSRTFKNATQAKKYIRSLTQPTIVIKASGLAAGKGVIIPQSIAEAIEAVDQMMVKREFGAAGDEIIIQEKLSGYEISLLAFTDGKTIVPLLPAQDHKRVFDHDLGPNTGGMGAYSPVPHIQSSLLKKIERTILRPTIEGMKREGAPYQGVLYAGLMMTPDGPKVLEFNVRFGDPETQPQLMLLKSDLLKILLACVDNTLQQKLIRFRKGAAICVVLSAQGYPDKYQKGEIIHGLDKKTGSDVQIFHAGTSRNNNLTITAGGRVLGVTTYGKNINEAIKKAYRVIDKKQIYFDKMHYRKDIGKKAT